MLSNYPPSKPTIVEYLQHPGFEHTGQFERFVGNRPIMEVADEIEVLAHEQGAIPHFVGQKIAEYKWRVNNVRLLAQNNIPEIPEIRTSPTRFSIRNFSDMAAARKAGGYPIPENYPKHERSRTTIGAYHTSSGEWKKRIDVGSASHAAKVR